ncbi:MAG: trigger factor [Legionellales bacterium]|nr:trigger factor [Legionellales bacterium]
MQVSLESAEGLKRTLSVSVDPTEVEQQVRTKLTELAKQVRIPGFRPGKIPLTVMKQQYGDQVKAEVAANLVEKTFPQAVSEQGLTPVTQPQIDVKQFEDNRPFIYHASFEVLPETMEITDLTDAEIEQVRAQVTSQDVNETLEKLREQHIDWLPAQRPAQANDQVVIDFNGTIEGEPLPNGSATDFTLELTKGNMIEGFEAGIIGMQVGEQKTLLLTFPAEYHHQDVAGKPVEFVITMKQISQAHLPELNDEFAQKFDVSEGGLAKLTQEVEQNMQRELTQELEQRNKEAVFDQWLANNTVEIPDGLVDEEIKSMQQRMMQRMTGGKEVDMNQLPGLDRQMFEEPARKRVALSILIRQYIDQHQLKVDEQKVQQHLEKIAQMYDKSDEMIQWYQQQPQQMQTIEAQVLEQQVVDALLANASVVYQDRSFAELMHADESSVKE